MTEADTSSVPPYQIKSRPDYGRLRPVPQAAKHLIAAEATGIQAVLRMLGEAGAELPAATTLVYAEAGHPATHDLDVLRGFGVHQVDVVPDSDEALRYLERLLDGARMGTQLYLAGSESFIGQAVNRAIERHLHHTSIVTELSGSLARRVQCVHCKSTAEDVTTSLYECPGCGLTLFVRDHYSRRLAAFQGVCANAEDPDEPLTSEELYR